MRKFTVTELEYTMILSSMYTTYKALIKEEKDTQAPQISQAIAKEIIKYKELYDKLINIPYEKNNKRTY